MTDSITLRLWQREALQKFMADQPATFMTVACPGAGKTTFALTAARQWLGGQRRPVVVVVPTAHLKRQWADAALRFGLHLDPAWVAADGQPAPDMHGVVVTYAQVSSSRQDLARYVGSTFGATEDEDIIGGLVILDEIHHAASERSWGDGVEDAFGLAGCRLLLSGTPFRTDDSPIPFVRYSWGDYGEAEADYEYGYGEALRDGGVVRPVYFPRFDGHMEWLNADGEHVEATFEDDLVSSEWSARLRTALAADGEWIKTVLGQAEQQLRKIREDHPDAGGLVIAADQEHARAIARLLRLRHGIDAALALSDDPNASDVIEKFAHGTEPWVVAVRMISEGVDIPRLRVAVYATTTTTAMFFRQAVGRIARWTPGLRTQKAYMYLPADLRLRGHAALLATQRRHSIELRKTREQETDFDRISQPRDEEQLSLFSALSSTAVDSEGVDASVPLDGIDPDEKYTPLLEDLEGFAISLAPPPALPGRDRFASYANDGLADFADAAPTESRAKVKAQLRDRNSNRVRELVARSGLSYPEVNQRLNRDAAVERITLATIAQLERRITVADKWLKELARQGR